jgi:hypothetical protein
LNLVAHPLRLDYTQLKKRLGAIVKAPMKAAAPAFVELISAHPEAMAECVIEFESSIGSKMRIQWKGASAPDWTSLLRACGKRSDDSHHGADARAGGDRAGRRAQ